MTQHPCKFTISNDSLIVTIQSCDTNQTSHIQISKCYLETSNLYLYLSQNYTDQEITIDYHDIHTVTYYFKYILDKNQDHSIYDLISCATFSMFLQDQVTEDIIISHIVRVLTTNVKSTMRNIDRSIVKIIPCDLNIKIAHKLNTLIIMYETIPYIKHHIDSKNLSIIVMIRR